MTIDENTCVYSKYMVHNETQFHLNFPEFDESDTPIPCVKSIYNFTFWFYFPCFLRLFSSFGLVLFRLLFFFFFVLFKCHVTFDPYYCCSAPLEHDSGNWVNWHFVHPLKLKVIHNFRLMTGNESTRIDIYKTDMMCVDIIFPANLLHIAQF